MRTFGRRDIWFPILALLVLTGCGYHLRGSTGGAWNLGRIYVQNAVSVGGEVQRLLTLNEVTLAGSPADADTILTFTHETQDRQVLSVDPDTGKVREYELVIDTGILVARPDGTVLLQDDSMTLTRDYIFDEASALGEFTQESTLLVEMRRDLAAAILRRLQTLGAQSGVASTGQ